jgi:aspartate aminotransferase
VGSSIRVRRDMIESELESLLAPLERFERIRRRASRLGNRLADLSYANPYPGAQSAAKAAIVEALQNERLLDLQYAPFGGHTLVRRSVADALRDSHGLSFTFNDVALTSGAMAALHVALRLAADGGGEVVIPTPCWLDYPLYARHIGLEPKLVELQPPDFALDPERLGAALTPRTCALLLSHPANPTGRSYRADELTALGGVLRAAESELGCRPTLIADETHRDFVPDGRYLSLASIFDRTVVVYSFGKYHFIQGQRLGYAAVSPHHPNRLEASAELIRWTRITGLCTPTALMQRAVAALLSLRYDQSWLDDWRRRFLNDLEQAGYVVVPPDATLFLYVRTPAPAADDFAFIETLASQGVLALPAPVFHHRGHFRLSLTGSETMLERGLSTLTRLASR